jgi:hypothetical protein
MTAIAARLYLTPGRLLALLGVAAVTRLYLPLIVAWCAN